MICHSTSNSILGTLLENLRQVNGEIEEKWNSFGGSEGFLGCPIIGDLEVPDGVGRYGLFQGGSIYWSPDTGAYEVHGAIRDKWSQVGRTISFLGYPITDELTTPDHIGRYNHFQGGSIYWTPNTGAHEVHGAIRGKWASLGWERGSLGYPITDELLAPSNLKHIRSLLFLLQRKLIRENP